jgi:hypothetical protein
MPSLFEAVHAFTQHLPGLKREELLLTIALSDEVCLPCAFLERSALLSCRGRYVWPDKKEVRSHLYRSSQPGVKSAMK